ncbi:trypsin beta-like [Topomyia yanbarensis]|uniref:trypsin beta-like n=1 Tax=Topomyia yanbarensis TaxID=2498891 RepID=UPI00273C421D|nr:trypsin beta-like [Topomyia yanbarensis]
MELLEICLLLITIGSISAHLTNGTFHNGTYHNGTLQHPFLNNTNITLPVPLSTGSYLPPLVTVPPQSRPSVIPLYKHPHYDESGTALWFPRIVGGTPATFGEFPSKVSIQLVQNSAHFCGGTLLTMKHVLTAAHCVTNDEGIPWSPSRIQAMADDLNVLPKMASSSRQIRQVKQLVIHDKYRPSTLENDIAVARLVSEFTKTNSLYPSKRVSSVPAAGELCVLAGWGVTAEHSQTVSPTLQRVNLAVVDFDRCNLAYQGSLTRGMMCAGAPGRDACQGDSGGALMCQNRVAGVVSFGAGCAHPDFPGVYMDVAHFEKWIGKALSGGVGRLAVLNGWSALVFVVVWIKMLTRECLFRDWC